MTTKFKFIPIFRSKAINPSRRRDKLLTRDFVQAIEETIQVCSLDPLHKPSSSIACVLDSAYSIFLKTFPMQLLRVTVAIHFETNQFLYNYV